MHSTFWRNFDGWEEGSGKGWENTCELQTLSLYDLLVKPKNKDLVSSFGSCQQVSLGIFPSPKAENSFKSQGLYIRRKLTRRLAPRFVQCFALSSPRAYMGEARNFSISPGALPSTGGRGVYSWISNTTSGYHKFFQIWCHEEGEGCIHSRISNNGPWFGKEEGGGSRKTWNVSKNPTRDASLDASFCKLLPSSIISLTSFPFF